MAENTTGYPATLSISYPEKPLDKTTTLFRLFTVIPIAIILLLIIGGSYQWETEAEEVVYQLGSGGGMVFLSLVLMILFQQKYPRWWFDWNVALTKFAYRVIVYIGLMRDEYPSTDDEQAVHINLEYPDVKKDLNRWLPLVKWFLAIPHYIVLAFLSIAAVVCVIVAWFNILFTGQYPEGLFNFVSGVLRWSLRVAAYAGLMITDTYPPFSLDA